MSKRLLVIGVLVMGLALWAGMATAQGGEEPTGDPVRGAALYAENCLACHGAQGEPLAAHEAFASEIVYDDTFAEVTAQGVEGTYMGAWGEAHGGPLSEADLLDLTAYAQTWVNGEDVPPLPQPEVPTDLETIGSGDPNAGAGLFTSYCAACHGSMGEGRGLTHFPAIDPSDTAVLTATRRGMVGVMPPFAEANGGPLSEDEIVNIMAYIRTWDRPTAMQAAAEASPGGAGLLILLIGIGAMVAVGGFILLRSRNDA